MPEQTITIEANSIEEAKELLKTKLPEGFQIVSEEIVSDGNLKVIQVTGDSTESALQKAKLEIPTNAELLEWKEISPSEHKFISVDAEDDLSAQTQTLSKITGRRPAIKRVSLLSQGSKGFLGIGKKLNQYQVEVVYEAIIEVTYQPKAKISTTIVKLEPQEIAELVAVIDNIWVGDAAQIAAAEKLSKQGGKDAIEPLIKLTKNEEIKVRGIALSALANLRSILDDQTARFFDETYEQYDKDKKFIEDQIEPLVYLLKPLVALGSNRGPEFQKLTEQIREIGEKINDIGGHSGMWIPYNQIKALYPYPSLASFLDDRWHLIGTWQR